MLSINGCELSSVISEITGAGAVAPCRSVRNAAIGSRSVVRSRLPCIRAPSARESGTRESRKSRRRLAAAAGPPPRPAPSDAQITANSAKALGVDSSKNRLSEELRCRWRPPRSSAAVVQCRAMPLACRCRGDIGPDQTSPYARIIASKANVPNAHRPQIRGSMSHRVHRTLTASHVVAMTTIADNSPDNANMTAGGRPGCRCQIATDMSSMMTPPGTSTKYFQKSTFIQVLKPSNSHVLTPATTNGPYTAANVSQHVTHQCRLGVSHFSAQRPL